MARIENINKAINPVQFSNEVASLLGVADWPEITFNREERWIATDAMTQTQLEQAYTNHVADPRGSWPQWKKRLLILLEKDSDGTITPEELQELNRFMRRFVMNLIRSELRDEIS